MTGTVARMRRMSLSLKPIGVMTMQRILMQYGREQVSRKMRFHPTEAQGKSLVGGQGRVHGPRAGSMIERAGSVVGKKDSVVGRADSMVGRAGAVVGIAGFMVDREGPVVV